MTWYDVDDVLYEGNEKEIRALRCPSCGGHIFYTFAAGVFRKKCTKCGAEETDYKGPVPNCVMYLGKTAIIQ